LNRKNISFLEMFNFCDINDDSRVNLGELRNFVESLSADFKQKEIHALMAYVDIDKNGTVDREEFMRQLNKAEMTMRQTQIINKQIAEKRVIQRATQRNNYFKTRQAEERDDDDLFRAEEIAIGD